MSLLEGLVFMAVAAAIGGAVAVAVNNTAAPLITAIFALVGTLLVFSALPRFYSLTLPPKTSPV